MKTIYEYCEEYFSPFNKLRDLEKINESSVSTDEIKNWVSQNYQIAGQGKKTKYKPLPKKCIFVDKSTGNVTISKINEVSYDGYIYLNNESDTFTNGFKITKIEGSLKISGFKGKTIKGTIEEVTNNVTYIYCDNLTSLKNSPKVIGNNLRVVNCNSIISLKCSTKSVSNVDLLSLKRIEDLNGLPATIEGDINITECPMLKSYGDLADSYKSKVKFKSYIGGVEAENTIEKWKETLTVVNGGSSLLDLADDEQIGDVTYAKHDIAALLIDNCGWHIKEEEIKIIDSSRNSKDGIEIEIHIPGVPDHVDHQYKRRILELSKKTKLSALVGKVKIVNYVDNFDIIDAGPDLTDFNKVFVNANPWRLRLAKNNSIKNLSCLKPIVNVPFRRIYIGECSNIVSLDVCPDIVSMHIYIEDCPKFKEFGCQLPDKVDWVRVIRCPKFSKLDGIAKEMNGLECYATNIKSFEGGIENVNNVDAHNCQNLTSFKGLPEGYVKYLIVTKCSKLNSLDGIPKEIYNLSIKGTQLGPFRTKKDLLPHCTVVHTLSK